MAPSHVLTAIFSRVTKSTERKVGDILDVHHNSLALSKDDESLLVQVKKVGVLQVAFSTFVTYPGSFAFWTRGPDMI